LCIEYYEPRQQGCGGAVAWNSCSSCGVSDTARRDSTTRSFYGASNIESAKWCKEEKANVEEAKHNVEPEMRNVGFFYYKNVEL